MTLRHRLLVVLGCIAVVTLHAEPSPESASEVQTPFLTTADGSCDMAILGDVEVPLSSLERHIRSRDPGVDEIYLRRLYELYRDACRAEGVSLVVALAQMAHETDYLRFTGSVRPIQYNYAGLGSTSVGTPGLSFPTMRTGVYAHVQHLRAYADDAPLATALVDPRFRYVVRASAPTVRALSGRWASDPDYGTKVIGHIAALIRWARD